MDIKLLSNEIKRPRGRPRSFDEDEAIRLATEVFWAKGFDATTVDDLVEKMGVQRPSLYAIFGDKAALFIRCLQAYEKRFFKLVMEPFLTPQDVHKAVRALLRLTVENATGEKTPSGCLFLSVASMIADDQVRTYLSRSTHEMTALVARRLKQSVRAGELARGLPCEGRARLLMDLSCGLVLRARLGATREQLLKDADDAAALILHTPLH